MLGSSSDSLYMTGSLHASVSLQAVGSDGAAPLVCHRMLRMQPHSPGMHFRKMLGLGVSAFFHIEHQDAADTLC